MTKGKYVALLLVGLLTAMLAGCNAAGPTAAPPPAAPVGGTIRFFDISNVDVRDVPMLMALDALKEQGYNVEITYLSDSALIASALADGDADIGLLNNQTMWTAIEKGADVRTVAQSVGSTNIMAAPASVETCDQLDGQSIALANLNGLNPALFYSYMEQTCPEAEPQYIALPDSGGRAAALLAGELGASTMPGEEFIKIDQQAPGQFHVLMSIAEEFPEVQVEGLHVRREWAEANPVLVQDFLRELLLANREVAETPQRLVDEAVARLELDEASAQAIADSHLSQKIWDPNGGLTEDNVQQTLDFVIGIELLPDTLEADAVADLSYLNAVLDEIGRR